MDRKWCETKGSNSTEQQERRNSVYLLKRAFIEWDAKKPPLNLVKFILCEIVDGLLREVLKSPLLLICSISHAGLTCQVWSVNETGIFFHWKSETNLHLFALKTLCWKEVILAQKISDNRSSISVPFWVPFRKGKAENIYIYRTGANPNDWLLFYL